MTENIASSTTTSKSVLSVSQSESHPTHTLPEEPEFKHPQSLAAVDQEKQDASEESQPPTPPTRKPVRWFFICIAIYVATFLYGLDNTIVADIQASTVETFGEIDKLAWLGTGFPLGSVAIILSLGKAFAVFDVKWLFNVSQLMFVAGSALCGGAPSMNALIVGRVWAGAGGAGLYLGLLNIVGIYTNDKERPIYNSLCGFIWGAGCILGPVVGGSFADSAATWRWAFYINLCLVGLFSPISLWILESNDPQPDKTLRQKLAQFDWIGMVLNAGVFAAFVILFTVAGVQFPWSDGRTIALFVVVGILLIAFGLQQSLCLGTTAEYRIFPVDFLKRRSVMLMTLLASVIAPVAFANIYYISLYFAFVHGDSGVESAIRLLPFICCNIFTCMLNGFLMPVYQYYYPWFLSSGVITLAGAASMYATLDVHTSPGLIYGLSILMAVGSGLSLQAPYAIATAKVSPARLPDAVSLINSAQIGSIVIALTVAGSIFQNVGFRHVAAALDATGEPRLGAAEIRAALAGAKSAVLSDADPATRSAVLAAIVEALADEFLLVVAGGAIATLASLFLRREKLFVKSHGGTM